MAEVYDLKMDCERCGGDTSVRLVIDGYNIYIQCIECEEQGDDLTKGELASMLSGVCQRVMEKGPDTLKQWVEGYVKNTGQWD
jgi:hypothetical protein